MPRKYSVEFKEKAVHQIIEMVRLESCSLQRAYTEVGELLGVSHHTLRAWYGPDPRKVDTSGVSYAAWVSVAELSASKSSGARRLHQECRLRVL